MKRLREWLKDLGLFEYALTFGLVALALVGGFNALSTTISDVYKGFPAEIGAPTPSGGSVGARPSAPIPPGSERGEPPAIRIPPPPPELSQFDALKQFITRMRSAPGALNANPDRAEVGQDVAVTLTISPRSTIEQLRTRTELQGGAADVRVAKIAARMRAQLIAPAGVTVVTAGSEERAVSDQDDTMWHWTVTPNQTGDLALKALLIAPVDIDGKETPYEVRAFEAKVTVFVTPTTWVRRFASAHWEWLWTVLLIPIGKWLWGRKSAGKSTPAPGQPS
jgi:Flp pilus assembly pilin Flp